jgi:hypothetical protein
MKSKKMDGNLEFITLENSPIFASLVSGVIAYNLIDNSADISSINNYLPWQFNLNLFPRIINLIEEEKLILTEEHIYELLDCNEAEMAIALYPLIIYCYKNDYRLEQELETIINYSSSKDRLLNDLRIFTEVIYLILDKKIEKERIISPINSQIDSDKIESIRLIQFIETAIEQKLPLTKVEEKLIAQELYSYPNLGIYQALYSFFCLPENWEISLSRSKQFSQQQLVTSILTGLLLGLYHGYLGIPNHWRKKISSKKIGNQKSVDSHFVSYILNLENISHKLVARWQGKLDNKI